MLVGGADEGFWLGRHTVSSTAQISCAQEPKLAQTFWCLGTSVESLADRHAWRLQVSSVPQALYNICHACLKGRVCSPTEVLTPRVAGSTVWRGFRFCRGMPFALRGTPHRPHMAGACVRQHHLLKHPV